MYFALNIDRVEIKDFTYLLTYVIKTKIVTIQWIKSRIWDTIDEWYINNLAKSQVSAVFHSRVICRSVSPKFIELCMETPCLCPSEGRKHGGRIKSNRNICHWGLLLNRKIIALELRHIERNVCSSASTVQLAKTKVITHLLTYTTAFSGRNVHVTQHKSLEIQTYSFTVRKPLSSWIILKRQVPIGFFIWWN